MSKTERQTPLDGLTAGILDIPHEHVAETPKHDDEMLVSSIAQVLIKVCY